MLHQSLEKEREPGDRRQTKSILTPSDQTGLNRIKLDLTGLN